MKRISFFLVILCALILSVGLNSAQAGQGVVAVKSVGGLFVNDTVAAGQNIRFAIGFDNTGANGAGEKCNISNGWVISSFDGAAWDSVVFDTIPANTIAGVDKFLKLFPVTNAGGFGGYSVGNGAPTPDTVGTLQAGNPGPAGQQMPITWNDTIGSITVYFTGLGAAGKHICIDSAFFGVGGTWTWVGKSLANYYPTWVNTVAGAPVYNQSQGGFCYFIYNIPNLPPTVVNTGTACPVSLSYSFTTVTLTQSHCTAFTYDFDACDAEGDPYTFVKVGAGPGTVNSVTGVWSATGLATGPYTVVVRADDAQTGTKTGTVQLNVTNAAPTIAGACGSTITTSTNTNTNANFTSTDADACDPKNWSIVNVAPPGPTVGVVNGLVTFNSAAAGDYVVTVGVSDGIVGSPTTCDVTFHVLAGSLYGIQIEKTHNTLQGMFECVDVTLKGYDPALGLGGFDLLISYDNSALSLQSVVPGALYTDCKWEFFTYRFGANGNCSGGCPSGLVRVTGLAETNNGANHPLCFNPPSVPEVMFSMCFLVSNNRTFECQYVPIRFFWLDCGDNTLSSIDGSWLIIEKNVYDYHNQLTPIDPLLATFPGYAGVPIGACYDPNLPAGKHNPKRDIDFYDGGIDIVCADSIDARGDINLNSVSNEIADAVMFTNYFINGLSAFGTHVQGSIAATDVNADGISLSVADLVYLIRVIVGDALPYPKAAVNTAKAVNTSVTNESGKLATTGNVEMGGAFIVVAGNVTPTLLAKNMDMSYAFDGQNTRIIVTPSTDKSRFSGFQGEFINVNTSDVVSIELATITGEAVAAKITPKSFALNQNYPNPFNPTTNISFALPTAAQYTLTIYNVTGQTVAEYSDYKEAGNVTINVNLSNNASGIYFYKLTAGSFTETKKMVLLK